MNDDSSVGAMTHVYECRECGHSTVAEQTGFGGLFADRPTVGCYDCGVEMTEVHYA